MSKITEARVNEDALVLLSGGLDSIVTLFWARQVYKHVRAVAFDYGQRFRVELTRAQIAADMARTTLTVLKLPAINNTWQGRNAIFLSHAAMLARDYDTPNIVIGTSKERDRVGDGDSRGESMLKMAEALELMFAWPQLVICAPLILHDKVEILREARALGDECWSAVRYSWSCLEPQPSGAVVHPKPCGTCPGCMRRSSAFELTTLVDPSLEMYT